MRRNKNTVFFNDGKRVVIVLDKEQANGLVLILNSAINQKPLNKVSNAYKLAKQLDDELPA